MAASSRFEGMPGLCEVNPTQLTDIRGSNYACKNCAKLPHDVIQLMCGHLVGVHCARDLKKCPECNEPMRGFRDKSVKQKILSFSIRCPTPKCEWCGPYDDYQIHAQECSRHNGYVMCPFCDCCRDEDSLAKHMGNCKFRVMPCPHCKSSIPYNKFEDHVNECGDHVNECGKPGCEIPVDWIMHESVHIFICQGCGNVPVEPFQNCCGHLIGKRCLTDLRNCPACNEIIIESSADNCPREEIASLSLRCPHLNCPWFGPYEDHKV